MTIHIFKNPDNNYFQLNCIDVETAALDLVHKVPRKMKISIRLRCPFCEKTVSDNTVATMKNHILTMHEAFRHHLSYKIWKWDSNQ